MKLKNSNCDETQKLQWWWYSKTQMWWNSKTQIVMKLKNSNFDKTQNCDKHQKFKMRQNSHCDTTQELKSWQNSENFNGDKTENLYRDRIWILTNVNLWRKINFKGSFTKNILTMRWSLGSILQCFFFFLFFILHLYFTQYKNWRTVRLQIWRKNHPAGVYWVKRN